MITLTTNAQTELKNLLLSRAATPDQGLRLRIARGGCAGMSYEMKVTAPEEQDAVIDFDGGRLIIAADSIDFLNGCEINYSYELSDSGFKIENPNAERSCGCGTSFEPKEKPDDFTPTNPEDDGQSCK